MNREVGLEILSHKLLLLADKALYWPERRLMCVADTHFGKAAAYRALGLPVPRGTTTTNLLRLDSLLASYSTRHLIFLGDFLHAPKSHAPTTLAALHEWRQRHADIACALIRGNHDLRAGDPPAMLDIEIHNEPLLVGPFALRHTPIIDSQHHVIAGHQHPVFNVRGKGRQSLRLPCFYSSDRLTVLPAFGDFTGGHSVQAHSGIRLFITDGRGVWPVGMSKA